MGSMIRTGARGWVWALVLAGTGACTAAPAVQPAKVTPVKAGQLEVVNHSSLDMDLFLIRHGGQRSRLGLAPGSATTRFALTPAQVAGAGPVVFQAVPTLRVGQAVTSDPVAANQKDAFTLDIPPQ